MLEPHPPARLPRGGRRAGTPSEGSALPSARSQVQKADGEPWQPPPGDWLAGLGDKALDLDTAQLMDDATSAAILRDLRDDPPPKLEDENTPRNPRPGSGKLPRVPLRGASAPSDSGGRPPSGHKHPLVANQPQNRSAGLLAPGKRPAPVRRQSEGAKPTGNKNDDAAMISSLAARLSQVEKLNAAQAATIARKSAECDRLSLENQALKQAGAEGAADELLKLQQAKQRLEKRVAEMTQFLEDYGLRWVGDARSDQDESEFDGERLLQDVDQEKREKPCYAPEGWSVNVNKIQAAVRELNAVAEQDAKIVRTGGVAKFKQQDPVPLIFWQDGLQVGDFPFWPYSHANAARVLADISESYFPYCLKEKFPEGVLLKVVDKVKEPFDEQKAKDALLPQGGHVLGGAPKPPCSLVGRLPDKVIKSGQVVEVAGPVQAMVGPGDGVQHLDLLAPGRLENAPCVTLSVRFERGDKVVLRTEVETTVGAVLAALNKVRRERKMPSIAPGQRALCTNMPPRTYESEEETVTQAGLAPNAALFVRVLGAPAE